MGGRFRRKTNKTWWERLDKAAQQHQVTWEWVEGHAGHVIQETVDWVARTTAKLGQVDGKVLREAVDRIGTIEVN
jgi:ribonuclease HI